MKKTVGILAIAAIYIAAGAVGIALALLLPLAPWLSLLIADVASTVVVFAFSLLLSNASVYDPYWSVQPVVIAAVLLIGKGTASPAVLLPCAAIFLWGLRLTANWAYTFRGLAFQDWRYTMLAEKTGKLYFFVNFFGIHLVPTLIVYACTLPLLFLFLELPAFGLYALIPFVFSLLAVLLEGTADCTMHRFRRRGGKGFLRAGVWKYSRHPNYLGEICFWWGIGLFAVSLLPRMWWLLAGALANTLLFLLVSIPLADGHQSRKDGFALYKKNTRMLLPLYKKQHEASEERR